MVDQAGMVTGVAAGNATVTVTTADGGKTATCAVTVNTYAVNSAEEWSAALSDISNAPEGSSADNPNIFIINIMDNVSVPGTYDNSITGDDKEVWLTGSGTLSLESNGSLIWTEANQTFIIDGPTLQGKSGNDTSLVYIRDSAVELRSGCITGNTSGDSGGGVYVDGGKFKMTGGEISSNHVNSGDGGGGVYVYNSSFTMTDGKISGNTATISDEYDSGSGGGVCVVSGSFEMSGGEISDNHADGIGGGVCVDDGSFTMTDSVIYGNDADPASLRNTASSGAAVYKNGNSKENTIYSYP
jgi:hypothetical protein